MDADKDRDDILGDWQIFFFLGVAGFFFGFFFLLIWVILAVIGAGIGDMFVALALMALAPGAVLMFIGMRKRGSLKDLESLAEVLRAYRRIKIARVAEKLGITEFEAEKRISTCIDRGLVKGYIDRKTDEFFTLESVSQVVEMGSCPKCGAPPDRIVLVGEQPKCGSCGAVVR